MAESKFLMAQTALCKRSFIDFIRAVKPDYIFNWHHEELISALQRLGDREITRLLVQMPPRHGKSELVSRLFPAWILGRNQDEQIIAASYSADLSGAMNRDCQKIITSEVFKEIFPTLRAGDRSARGSVMTSARFDMIGAKGYYVSAGVGGGITGVGATVAIIDDPVKNAEEADSPTRREKTWQWYTTTFKTRFEPGAIEIICQTRWHEDDLTGRVLKQISERGGGKTEVVCFPALCDGPEYDRVLGEPLWNDKYDRAALLDIKSDVGSRSWNALYQQKPSPDEGNMLKKKWFSWYNPRDLDITQHRVNFYFDTAYTKDEKNDPCAGLAYVKIGADYYIIDCQSKHLEFTEQIKFVQSFTRFNGYTWQSIIRIEPKATGKSVVQVTKKATSLNIKEAISPKDSKVSRVRSIEPTVEAGRVFLPLGMAWTADFLDECATFPNATHDDRVDCLTGMILNEQEKNRKRSSK
jgi:predicted phage terminase large subunit-like protein